MNVFVFSPDASYCKQVLQAIISFGLKQQFQFLNVSTYQDPLPAYIKSVPTIITHDRRILVDQDVWRYVQFLHSISGSRQPAQPAQPAMQQKQQQGAIESGEPEALFSGQADNFTTWDDNSSATAADGVSHALPGRYSSFQESGGGGGPSLGPMDAPQPIDVAKPQKLLDSALEEMENQRMQDYNKYSPAPPQGGRGIRAPMPMQQTI
jgi:hypothetical protein